MQSQVGTCDSQFADKIVATMSVDSQKLLTIDPIGYVRTSSRFKFDAPNQPSPDTGETNVIELIEGRQFDLALTDLEGFDHIWVLSWFDRNKSWRPRVMPPRGPAKRRGVFATRSPHRPNPIGLTCVPLLAINGLRLTVGALDLTDATPVLDLKPYLRTVDCFPASSLGWVEPIESEDRTAPTYNVIVSATAQTQLEWLRATWQVDFTQRAFSILQRDPMPHRTRRILQLEQNRFRMACGAWRVYYRIEQNAVVIEEIDKGYSDASLATFGLDQIIDGRAQAAFATWKSTTR